MSKVILIDGNNACYRGLVSMGIRAAHGMAITGSFESEVTACVIYGLLNIILKMGKKFQTNRIVVAWDSKESVRKQKYPVYKSERRYERVKHEKNPVSGREFVQIGYKNFEYLRTKLLPYIGFNNQLYQAGYEGDDLIAMLVKTYKDTEFIVVSNDKDMYQLLDHCDLWRYNGGLFTKNDLIKYFKIHPSDWVKFRAIVGDPSDCLLGVKGVGTAFAAQYLNGKMNKETKRYEAIVSEEGRNTIKRNEWLMQLPLPGTKPIKLVPDKLSFDRFLAVSNKYGFELFLKGTKLRDWKKFFHNKL